MRAPRLLQSVFSAVGDLYLYKLAAVLFGDSVAKWTVSYDSVYLSFFFFFLLEWVCLMFEVLAALHSPILYMKIENFTLSQLFSQLSNWFMFYCFSRTLSNSLETVLTLVSLYFWPCMRPSSNCSFVSRKWGLAVAAVACAYPTNKCNHMAVCLPAWAFPGT